VTWPSPLREAEAQLDLARELLAIFEDEYRRHRGTADEERWADAVAEARAAWGAARHELGQLRQAASRR
jgi:hypothetical protein